MILQIGSITFTSIKSFINFCNTLKKTDKVAWEEFLKTEEQQPDKEVIKKQQPVLVRYNGYSPVFFFQTKQKKAIPVYNTEFRPDINSRFVTNIKVPYKGTNTQTPVRLYYNFITEERYAVIVKEGDR